MQNKVVPAVKYYPFLDGFRAFSVLWVLWHHLLPAFPVLYPLNNTFFRILLRRLSVLGFLGVDVFFVISGFLITGLLLEDLNSTIRLKRFYVRRFFKIVPHYLLILGTGFLFIHLLAPHFDYHPKSVISYFLFYQNYVDPIYIFGHLWSIAVEEHFYLLYPVLLWLICQRRVGYAERKSLLIRTLIFLIILGNIIRYAEFRNITSVNNPLVWQVTHVRFDGLMFGCLLRIFEKDLTSLVPRLKMFAKVVAFAIGCSLFAAFMYKFSKNAWYYYTLAYVASCSLIVSGLLGFQPLVRICTLPWLRYIGKNSYGIYLWHYLLKFPLLRLKPYLHPIQLGALFVILSLVLGILSTVTVEKYFLQLRKRIMP